MLETTQYPLPWRVEYDQKFDTWADHVRPRVVDANGETVVLPPQNVSHPGMYDELADNVCKLICDAVNR